MYDFSDKILPHLYIFNPKNALANATHEKVPSLVKLISNLPRIVDPNLEDQMQVLDDQWRLLVIYDFPKYITEVEEIDHFWLLLFKDDSDTTIFSNLAKFALTVLSLPHSNADCERIFSKINRTKTKGINKLIQKTVYSILMTSEGIQYGQYGTKINKNTCVTFKPPKQMLKLMNTNNLYTKQNLNEDFIDTCLFHS